MGRVFGRYTKSLYDNRTNSNLLDIGDRVFEQHDELAGVTHLGLPQQHRQPVARRQRRGPGGPERDRLPAG